MGELRITVNKGIHLLAWCAWAAFYWTYANYVATRSSFDWLDYMVFLVIHIGSFYFSVYIAFPWANPLWNRFTGRTGMRLALVILTEGVAIPVLLTLVSVLLGGLEVGGDADRVPEADVDNFPDVTVFLYTGLVFALVYLRITKLESERGELLAEVERLRIRLDNAELASLEQSLIPHLYSNLLGTVNDAVRRRPAEAPYVVNLFNQIVRFYASLGPGERVTLADEMAACELFLEMVEVKLGRPPSFRLEVEEASLSLKVIPMLGMLLLENVDKYGRWDDDGHVAGLSISVRLNQLVVMARNTVRESAGTPPLSTKKGLRSIRERLAAQEELVDMGGGRHNDHFLFFLFVNIH